MKENSDDNEESGYNIYTTVEKNMRDWQKINKIFKKTECENSIYIFSQTNKFRIFCMKWEPFGLSNTSTMDS